MDANTLIFIGSLAVVGLIVGISEFVGNKAEVYTNSPFRGRALMMGVFMGLLLLVSLFVPTGTEANTYALSYAFLFISSLFLIGGIALSASGKARAFWWRLVRRTEQKGDKMHLLFMMFMLSAGFFFVFFLLYPPFLSIG
jgi:hypothetical protein